MAGNLEGFSDNSSEDGEDYAKKWEASDDDFEAEDDEVEVEQPERKSLFERFGNDDKEDDGAEERPSLFAGILAEEDPAEEKLVDEPSTEVNPLANVYLNPETTDVSEVDPAAESIENEQFDAAVEQRIEQVDAEAASADAQSIGEVIADAEFLADTRDKLHEGEPPAEAIENARQEALENPIPDATEEEVEVELDESNNAEVLEGEIDISGDIEDDQEDAPDPAAQTSSQQSAATKPPPTPPPHPTPPSQPPTPPVVPPTPPPSGPGGPGGQGPGGPGGPNVPPNPFNNPNAQPNTPPQPVDTDPDDDKEQSGGRGQRIGPKIASAGAVGYMLGRRGGRKRAEARLQPQIDEKQRQIDSQEENFGRLSEQLDKAEVEVREAARLQQQEVPAPVIETPIIDQEQVAAEAKAHAETMAEEKEEFARHEEVFERVIDRRGVDDLPAKLSGEEAPVVLGAAESVRRMEADPDEDEERVERRSSVQQQEVASEGVETTASRRRVQQELNVNTMSQRQLLEVAASIPMENRVGLRQLFDARRIDERDMRRVVDAYLKGEDYERVLNQSLEKGRYNEEQKFEARDQRAQDPGAGSGGALVSGSTTVSDDSSALSASQNQAAPNVRQTQDAQGGGSPLDQMGQRVSDFNSSFADKPYLSNTAAAALGAIVGLIFIGVIALFTDLL